MMSMNAESISDLCQTFARLQGWQVSAEGGLNRGLNRFKPVRQKQVSASFCQCKFSTEL